MLVKIQRDQLEDGMVEETVTHLYLHLTNLMVVVVLLIFVQFHMRSQTASLLLVVVVEKMAAHLNTTHSVELVDV